MAEPGPEPGRAWRLLALCGAAVFLAAAAAGGALVAWNLAASAARGAPCPEPEVHNATVPPPTPPRVPEAEVRELQRRLAEAAQRAESLSAQLVQAERGRRGLQQALKACENQQDRLQSQLTTLKMEMDEAKAQGTQMGVENGALAEALARWEAAATESAQLLEEAQRQVGTAVAQSEACAAREVTLRERVHFLEVQLGGPQRKGPRPGTRSRTRVRPGSRSRSRTRPCRRPLHLVSASEPPTGW
ncbi:coiled-coil domain-containing protein 194 [Ochotona princeps]|uniref:coiled-coil domain-containing protein 194 n=1 Tax=Ochotona princeps TaxID=9978 RepID=UPI002714765B|nr:coiled-coil domain-containing protein 194 [Ochotona princeps]